MQAIEIGGVFIAGVASFFSPCILPVIPVFISTLIGGISEEGRTVNIGKLRLSMRPVLRVLMFVLGLCAVFVSLGFAFGALGRFLSSQAFLIICGIIVILFGVFQTGLVNIPFLMREKRIEARRVKNDLLSAFLLGFTFSFGWTPCIGPVLSAVLALTASRGGAVLGGLYLLVYSLGLLIPFLVFTVFSDVLLGRIRAIYKYMKTIKIVGGAILIIMGVLLMTGSLNLITAAAP